jgi:hypothetical protein
MNRIPSQPNPSAISRHGLPTALSRLQLCCERRIDSKWLEEQQ